MQWVKEYQLFLFDFDGLLVNTEEIHFQAYQKMCSDRGCILPWSFSHYCQAAHYSQEFLRQKLFECVPELKGSESDWDILYQEKKQAMVELLRKGAVKMMEGAVQLLEVLEIEGIHRCVVTNSPNEQIQLIKLKNPILDTIPYWFTRETYTRPKPDPECYQNAIDALCPKEGKVIGFEDSPRGMRALLKTSAKPVMITKVNYPELPGFIREGVEHFPSLKQMLDSLS